MRHGDRIQQSLFYRFGRAIGQGLLCGEMGFGNE